MIKTATPAAIRVKPYFYRPDARPRVVFIESSAETDEVVQRAVLTLSGTTGRLAVEDRSVPVQAKYDQLAGRKTRPTGEEEEEESDE